MIGTGIMSVPASFVGLLIGAFLVVMALVYMSARLERRVEMLEREVERLSALVAPVRE